MRSSLRLAVTFLAGICVVGSFPINARAQIVPWAMGAYGAMQACPYDYRVAGGAYSRSDEEKRIAKEIRKRDDDLSKFKREKGNAESKKRSAAAVLRRAFKGNFADFLIERHLDGMQKCTDYRGYNDEEGSSPSSIGTIDAAGRKGFNDEVKKQAVKGKIEVKVEFAYEWLKGYCDNSQEGGVYYEVCSDQDLRDADSKRVTEKDCKEAIVNYRKAQKDWMNANSDAERAERDIKDLETSLSDATERANENASRRQRGETTEARCEDCERPGINGPLVAANLLTGAAATLIGYSANKQVIQANSQLGWPTNATPSAISYGFPFFMNGIYGALGGQMGVGGFGCAGGIGGTGYPYGPNGMMGYPYGMNGGGWNPFGGALGYPYDMYGNPLNGGMFNPGMGTWGMNGPNGLGNLGMMYPGAVLGGVVGGVLGNTFLGGPLNGAMGGQLGGLQMMGPLGGAIGGVINGGIALGGVPLGGIPLNGAMGGVLNGGIPMNGIPMNGMINSMLSGPLNSVLNGGGVLNNGMYNQQLMQLQQQMLQQQMQYQMQQQQMYAQYLQQYQQVQYQRQVQLQGLYQELYSLTYRIQMISNGYAMGGLGGGGVLNGGIGGVVTGGIGGVLSGAVGGVLSTGGVLGTGGVLSVGTVTPVGSPSVTVPGRGR